MFSVLMTTLMNQADEEAGVGQNAQVDTSAVNDAKPSLQDARDARVQIQLGKKNRIPKKRDQIEEEMLKILKQDAPAPASAIELSFASHTKRLSQFLSPEAIDDVLIDIQSVVDTATRSARNPRVQDNTRGNNQQMGSNVFHPQPGSGSLMNLVNEAGLPPMPGPQAHPVPQPGYYTNQY